MKKIALALLLLLAVGGGVLGWMWRQATALPDWYDPQSAPTIDAHDVDPREPLAWTILPDELPAPVAPSGAAAEAKPRPKKGKAEMRNFHLRTHMKNPEARNAFRASRATYEDEHLEAGVIVNLSKVDRGKLAKKDRSFYEKVAKAFPSVAERDVHVALEDDPVTRDDGILQLGPDPQVRVGKLSYSLKTVAKRLGIPYSKLRADINREFETMKVRDPAAIPRP